MTRIILIEGLQGCGKTTIATWLSNRIAGWGTTCRWYEEVAPHSVGLHYMPEQYRDVADYMEAATARWTAFAAGRAAGDGHRCA